MKINKLAQAGTIESNDCLIQVSPSDTVEVEIDSIVIEKFGEAIYDTILGFLDAEDIICKVKIIDKGAYDYTVRARLITALRRAIDE